MYCERDHYYHKSCSQHCGNILSPIIVVNATCHTVVCIDDVSSVTLSFAIIGSSSIVSVSSILNVLVMFMTGGSVALWKLPKPEVHRRGSVALQAEGGRGEAACLHQPGCVWHGR